MLWCIITRVGFKDEGGLKIIFSLRLFSINLNKKKSRVELGLGHLAIILFDSSFPMLEGTNPLAISKLATLTMDRTSIIVELTHRFLSLTGFDSLSANTALNPRRIWLNTFGHSDPLPLFCDMILEFVSFVNLVQFYLKHKTEWPYICG